MATQIDLETLREWLDTGQPVTVLDIRSDEDRAQWAIPGSVHLNAYDALRAGQPGALADAVFPVNRPVVTVCNAGRISQTAADLLPVRGVDARALNGGMKAWSLAWNAADCMPTRRAPAGAPVSYSRHSRACRQMAPGTVVLPAHTSEPVAFDGRAIATTMADGARWLSGWLAPEDAFVARLTSGLPPTPPNFARIVELNEAGEFPAGDATDLEAGANRCAVR